LINAPDKWALKRRAKEMNKLLSVDPIREMGRQLRDSPGKFESSPIYTHFFWEAVLSGDGEDMENNAIRIDIEEEDRRIFPELAGFDCVDLYEDDNGFVYAEAIKC
jgi:hypothetical protein